MNVESFLIVVFGVVAVSAKTAFCCLGGERLSACNIDHLFVRLPCFCLGISLLCTRLSKHFSAVHLVLIVSAGDIRLLFKLLLKFRNVVKHTEPRLLSL